MARYALIDPQDNIVHEKDESRLDLDAGVRDGYEWLIIEVVEVDNSTITDTVREGPVVTIEESKVTKTYTTRDMTSQEIDDRDEGIAASEADQVIAQMQWRALDVLVEMAISSGLVNNLGEFATRFESPTQTTFNQYKNFIKNRL